MTAPIYVDDPPPSTPSAPKSAHDPSTEAKRVRQLEDEVSSLRETMARFAELVLGELKQVRQPGGAPGAGVLIPEMPPPAESPRRPWLLIELLRDVSGTFRMYFDPRYRVRRSTQLLVPLILGLFVANYFFFTALPLPGFITIIFEKAGDIVLAVLLYKVIVRETTRYREVLAQYAAWDAMRGAANPPGGRVVVSDEDAPHAQVENE